MFYLRTKDLIRQCEYASKASWHLQVHLNGERLPIKNFMEYVELYLPDKSVPRVHDKINDRWEIVVTAAPGQFQQVRLSSCKKL